MKNPWEKINLPQSDLNIRLVDSSHPLDLYWGLNTSENYLFIIHADSLPPAKSLPELEGLGALVTNKDGRELLILELKDNANWEIFHALCLDLTAATKELKNSKSGGPVILRRLERWQDFLKNKKSVLLSREVMKGLIGEILFLKKVANELNWQVAIESWKGPEGSPQDFSVNDSAIEVKCQSGSSRPRVKINSIDQLDPQSPKGFLAVYTLTNSDENSSFTLNSLAESIRQEIITESPSTRERFEDLLFGAGYVHNEKYDGYLFKETDLKTYAVKDGFPRLIASEIPSGILTASYEIHLDSCADFLEPVNF
jgi:hypothetical protein